MRLSYWQLSTLVLLAAFPLLAQQGTTTGLPEPFILCELPAGTSTGILPVQRPGKSNPLPPKAANVRVEYLTDGSEVNRRNCTGAFTEDAKQAFEYAAAAWYEELQMTQQLNIRTCFTNDFPTNILATTSATLYDEVGERALDQEALIYPQSVIEQLNGKEEAGADMSIVFTRPSRFYYGLNEYANPLPSTQYDFITVALHEMGHGLGFFGTPTYSEGESYIGRDRRIDDRGQPVRVPTVFDRAVVIGESPIQILELEDRSAELDQALTGQLGGLFFDFAEVETFTPGSDRLRLYTPDPFVPGSSYSHVDDPSHLMHHDLPVGNFERDITATATVLRTLGWAGEAQVAAPVTLTHFTGTARDRDIDLTWSTATETENEGFTIEHSEDGLAFTAIGYRAGQGTTTQSHDYAFTHSAPGAGLHYYRLRQTDFDGSVSLSELVAVTLTDGGAATVLEGPFPNPSNGSEVGVRYRSTQSGSLTLRVWSSAGRLVYEQPREVTAGINALTLGLQDHASGVYLLQVVDGSGLHTRSLRIQ